MKFCALILFSFLALSACQTRPDVVSEMACGSQHYMTYIGHNVSSITLPLDQNIRIISPGMDFGKDYIYDRVNLVTDRKGTVREIACG